jgi:hypothetical protein
VPFVLNSSVNALASGVLGSMVIIGSTEALHAAVPPEVEQVAMISTSESVSESRVNVLVPEKEVGSLPQEATNAPVPEQAWNEPPAENAWAIAVLSGPLADVVPDAVKSRVTDAPVGPTTS